MALVEEIKVPLLAVNDTTLSVVEVSLAPGARVNKGDRLMVFETSKTTYDVEAQSAGFIQYYCVADQDYAVGEVVARIFSEEAEALTAPALAPAPASGYVPTSASGHVSAAASGYVPAPASGYVPAAAHAGPEASSAGPAYLSHPASSGFASDLPPAFTDEPPARWEGETIFSQGAMALIETHGLDKALFRGRDLVSAKDVLGYLAPAGPDAAARSSDDPALYSDAAARYPDDPARHSNAPAGHFDDPSRPSDGPARRASNPAASTAASRAAQPAPVDPRKATAQKLTTAKRREIEYLGEVQHTGLTSTIHTYVETEGIFTHLNRSLRYLKNSLLPVIIYETSRLLTDYPQLNAWFAGDAIARYNTIDPGFAIDIDKGLKVAKIAAAGRKSLQEIEDAILALSGDYLDDKLKLEDITDITFTITDLSAEAVAFFQPLVNKMNSAILGISAIDEKMQRCTLSLTFDHRVTEGRTAARFLKELKERLESYRGSGGIVKEDIVCFKCYKTLAEDLAGTGFAHCVTPEGKEGYICQSCLKGF
jgi:pyruvate/2-oxoglutarate dehydrogenase complex dihydrolipoamide acyltransferase (E2) component